MVNDERRARIIKKLLIICLIVLLPSIGWSNKWVTSSGAGARNGTSLGNAWSQSDFESESGAGYAGETIFFSGAFSTTIDINISGTAGNHVILDGYEADNITYMDWNEDPGRAKVDTNGSGGGIVAAVGTDYVIIQDFEVTDVGTDNRGIQFYDSSNSNFIVRRCYIHDVNRGIGGKGDYHIIGGESGHGNVIKNTGTTTAHSAVIFSNADDIIVSYNHLYNTSTSWGIDGIQFSNGNRFLVEYNSIHGFERDTGGEDGIDIKYTASDVIFRFNHLYDNGFNANSFGVNMSNGLHTGVYIYGNWIEGSRKAEVQMDSDYHHDEIFIFANVLKGSQIGSCANLQSSSSGNSDLGFFNNTLIECNLAPDAGVDRGAIYVNSGDNWDIKNNIVYKSKPNETDYEQFTVKSGDQGNITNTNNIYWWPSHTGADSHFWGASGYKTLSEVQGLGNETNSTEENPDLTDIAGGNYAISGTGSGAYGAGVDMGGDITPFSVQGVLQTVPLGFGFGPSTSFVEGSLPVIEEKDRDNTQWDIGAYVYTEPESVGHRGVSIN